MIIAGLIPFTGMLLVLLLVRNTEATEPGAQDLKPVHQEIISLGGINLFPLAAYFPELRNRPANSGNAVILSFAAP
jgi:hypothetical protein